MLRRAIELPKLPIRMAAMDKRRLEAFAVERMTCSRPWKPLGVPLPNSLRISSPRLAAPECTTSRLRIFSRPRKCTRRIPPRSYKC